ALPLCRPGQRRTLVAIDRILRAVREGVARQARPPRRADRHVSAQPLPARRTRSVERLPEGARCVRHCSGAPLRGGRFAAQSVPQRVDHLDGALSREVSMRGLKPFTRAIGLVLTVLAGCDGRGGSSGLDVRSENAVIDRALQEKQCVDFQSLKICPAAARSPGTPAASPSVETDLGSATSIDCYQATPGGSCTYILRFVPHGFAAGTSFQALSRVDAANNPWVLGPDPVAAASSSSVTLVLTA